MASYVNDIIGDDRRNIAAEILLQFASKVIVQKYFDPSRLESLGEVANRIGQQTILLNGIYQDHFQDENRIMIHALPGAYETKTPDVWVLCWRKNQTVEATDIHDHCFSSAGIYVYRGDVEEKSYNIVGAWNTTRAIAVGKSTRRLYQGSTVLISAPYIHVFSATQDCSITVHVYYPPLAQMTIYKETDGLLLPVEVWGSKDAIICTVPRDPK